MAVYQQTGLPAISLPQGATSLPDKLLPILNQFEKIVLWMDNDEAGKLGAEKISYKLGEKRTHIVKHDEANLKDANDFLKSAP
jgi:twinkle protein